VDETVDIPAAVMTELRAVCLGLPEVVEEEAWVGRRWRIRGRTFAHVLRVNDRWPPAYARAAGTDGPTCVVMFRSAGSDLAVLRSIGKPYFAPPWRADEVGLVLGPVTDWTEVAELLTDSYCVMAPRKLAALVGRPPR